MKPLDEAIDRHCDQIERCNQRGERMLTLPDLLQAGTVDLPLAGYLLAAVSVRRSFMVGCVPGGGGKTTVMGALLNVTPADVELRPADSMGVLRDALQNPAPRCCFIGHEIGAGHYYAYLWGQELREYFNLAEAGHMLATSSDRNTTIMSRPVMA